MSTTAERYVRRFSIASPLAATITAGLFVLLTVMTTRNIPYEPIRVEPAPEFRPLPVELTPPDETEVTPRPPPPVVGGDPLPIPPVRPQPPDTPEPGERIAWNLPRPPVAEPGTGITSRDPLVLVVPRPDFPARAQENNIEGYAIVEFTVTAAGTTRDARIVETSPAGWFEKAALSATGRIRYQPKLVDGQPAEAPGMMYKFVFDLEN